MKKKIMLLFLILAFTVSQIKAEDYHDESSKRIVNDPFFQNVSRATELLLKSYHLGNEGKTIKSENLRKEAVSIFNKELYRGRVINSKDICSFVNKSNATSLWRHFKFSCHENHAFIFAFDKNMSLVIRNKKDVTERRLYEQAEDIPDGEEVEATIQLVHSNFGFGQDNSCYVINCDTEVIVSCRILTITRKSTPDKEISE